MPANYFVFLLIGEQMAMHARAQRRHKFNRLAVCVALAIPAAAHSQVAEPTTAILPEIKVQAQTMGATTEDTGSYTTGKTNTATPLSMSLRDTPQSVSVVTQQRIEDQGLVSITDVVNNVTGISVNQYETNRAGFTARGFDIDNLQIDGIPTTWDQAWSSGEVTSSLAIYDRVEVVRGATGLMTGVGNPSAAINLVRKRASTKELKGAAEIGVGSWNEHRVLVDVSTPVNEAKTVRARVVGEYQEGDSWVNLMSNKSQTVFATIEADLSPNTLLSVGVSRQENNARGPMWGSLPYWYSDGSKTNWDRSKTTAADWTRWDSSYENYYANLEHRFNNGWKVRASYSHGDRSGESYLLYLFNAPDRVTGLGMAGGGGAYQTSTKQDDIGLHASGPFQWMGRTHELAFGYMHSEQKFNSDTRGYIGVPVGEFNNWNGSVAEPAWNPWSDYQNDTTKQDALYGVTRFSLSDPLKLILGARITNYQKTGNGIYSFPYALHEREVTPYAGLIYDINDAYSLYASYTDIFQPQNTADISGRYLDPIVGKSAEAGVKGEFFGGRLNASFAVFQIKQDNLAQAVGVDGDGRTYYRAADGAKSTGFEFDLTGELAPGWNASAGYTQYDATEASGAEFNTIYPRKLLRLFTTYRMPDDLNALTVGGGVNWEGRTYTVDPNAPAATNGIIEQKAFSLVNLMARYDFSKQLSAQFNINNVFDEKYFGMFAAYGGVTYGAPRNATMTLKYRF